MARKKRGETGDLKTKLNKTTGDAAAMLTEQMEMFGKAARATLQIWLENIGNEEFDDADYYVRTAAQLAQVSAKLGEAIARMKSQSLQHIKVERLAQRSPIAPSSAPPDGDNPMDEEDDFESGPFQAGEGGGGKANGE